MNIKGNIKGYFDKSGHLNELGVSLYVDSIVLGEANQNDPKIEKHVEGCFYCKSQIIDLYSVLKEYDSKINEENSLSNLISGKKEKSKKMYRIKRPYTILFKVAALVIFIVGIGFFAIQLFNQKIDKIAIETESHKHDTLKEFYEKIKNDEDIIAQNSQQMVESTKVEKPGIKNHSGNFHNYISANFKESQNLESLVGVKYRDNEIIKIISPENGKVFRVNEVITFKWEIQPNKLLILKIFNNKEKIVFNEDDINENVFEFKNNLPQGIYYWKLETEDDLYYTGKFLIK